MDLTVLMGIAYHFVTPTLDQNFQNGIYLSQDCIGIGISRSHLFVQPTQRERPRGSTYPKCVP
jgi:hypothetical protein